MKCLEIKNGKGYFLNKEKAMMELDQIKKEDLMLLLDIATDKNQEFSMDDMENFPIDNPAHKIIYRSLYDKFSELLENRDRFKEESELLYKEAYKKYKSDNSENA